MTDEVVTIEPTYTAINDVTLMVEQRLAEGQNLKKIFNFQSWQMSIIYESTVRRYSDGSGPIVSTNTTMNTVDFDAMSQTARNHMRNMRAKLNDLLEPPEEQETEPTLDYETQPNLSPDP